MKCHNPIISILVAAILLIQFSGVLASNDSIEENEMTESGNAMAAQDDSEVISSTLQNETNKDLNYSAYLDLLGLIRAQYEEDLDYSSKILNDFVAKDIDARGAMTSTMTLFILTTETVDMLDRITPPNELVEYKNATQLALINLEGYLWNMVKFYETGKKEYANQARINFNESIIYSKDFNKPIQ
jgi:hypothetical protein